MRLAQLARRHLTSMPSFPESFFRYTSGRWLRDEQRELALRYVRFDVDALKQAAMACTGATAVDDIVKCAEGRSNRVFRLKLQNHRDVVARLPFAAAGPPHLVTASEVATIDFLRNRLNLPVPRVLDSASHASQTPVGAEYVIMDVAEGIELQHVWHGLTMPQKMAVVKAWFTFESKVLKAFSGGGYGSLYYRKDLRPADARDLFVDGVKDELFVLGPSVQPEFWGNRRDELDIHRGSWPDASSYLKSVVDAQRAWIKAFATAPEFPTPFELPARVQDPTAHLRLLDQYESVAEKFIPTDPQFLRPTLTLADAHSGNIFLSREALDRGNIEISAVIDWQQIALLPLYLQAQIPLFIDALGPPEQDPAETKREQEHLRKLYHALYFRTDTDVTWASALQLEQPRIFAKNLPAFARGCWDGGYVLLKEALVDVANDWSQIAGSDVPCPIQIPPEEVAQLEADSEAWMKVKQARTDLDSALGVDDDGWVPEKDYERAAAENRVRRDQWLATLPREAFDGRDPGKYWPYPV
ncbi:hypothetical protein EXIGLDRAFT_668875 [Exidia glandulosa HHB12029]|uniref:Altered inheritance of mitochondria protein 9, mitochondrial n=1 Tax=Exidia glandulosa HHB12029 TaxID=1314781 RepID=A0A165MEY1_EXIGL|nr:hypothetical protein EXIGLDRAFT_668875 [Exidia glandulosa HHB12029]